MFILVTRAGEYIDAESYESLDKAKKQEQYIKYLWAEAEGCKEENLPNEYQTEIFFAGEKHGTLPSIRR